ncbi:MAG TPA: hypothetical protein VIW27_12955, partial [Gammaproteobacteria bacterium]
RHGNLATTGMDAGSRAGMTGNSRQRGRRDHCGPEPQSIHGIAEGRPLRIVPGRATIAGRIGMPARGPA